MATYTEWSAAEADWAELLFELTPCSVHISVKFAGELKLFLTIFSETIIINQRYNSLLIKNI